MWRHAKTLIIRILRGNRLYFIRPDRNAVLRPCLLILSQKSLLNKHEWLFSRDRSLGIQQSVCYYAITFLWRITRYAVSTTMAVTVQLPG